MAVDFANREEAEFLEEALKGVLENPCKNKKIVLCFLDDNGDVEFSYRKCSYADLQHIGQEMINEGMLQLIAAEHNKIKRLIEEDESTDDN